MLMQPKMILSNFIDIYDIVVPKDNMLRQINEMVDFSFIYDELISKYCTDNGRSAIDPIRMFKYLLLKTIFDISDADVVERSKYDMSFKYFLGMAPEEEVINPSSLTKFRKLRLKDSNLLDLLISKTVKIAIDKKIIKGNAIIVDSTHTKARYNKKTPREVLMNYSKNLRKAIYNIDESLKESFPKNPSNGILEDELEYSKSLVDIIEKNETIARYPSVKEKLNILKESIEDNLENLQFSKDKDAKVGHKTADTSFFGYKTHLALTEERIITAAVITSGEKHDGKQLIDLIGKSKASGINVEEVIGDAAYSEKDNLDYTTENNIKLISRLSKTITHGNSRNNPNEFYFNKDAGMYVCAEGHMSIKKINKRAKKNEKDGLGDVETYFFDTEKCKICPKRNGCYKDGAKTKSYSVSIKANSHQKQLEFQNTEYFKERSKERYKIEAKNSEVKHKHGYDVATSSGLIGMHIQGAMTLFTVNLKRIIKLTTSK